MNRPSMTDHYHIRTLQLGEIDTAVDWAAAEGWNPGVYDARCFHAADPHGFLGGFIGDELIATISAVKYGHTFGFIGFYIVKADYRSHGYGLKLWNAALASLGNRLIGLDGVFAQQENYRKSGFALAYTNVRYQGVSQTYSKPDHAIVHLSEIPFAALAEYDRQHFSEQRSAFLKCWINQPGTVALAITDNNQLSGYGVIRPCREGYKIGPLFADNVALADRLFLQLQSTAAGKLVFLDVPSMNADGIALAEAQQMTPVFQTARMYKNGMLHLPVVDIFGVTSFELG
jgi:hypothetical protein